MCVCVCVVCVVCVLCVCLCVCVLCGDVSYCMQTCNTHADATYTFDNMQREKFMHKEIPHAERGGLQHECTISKGSDKYGGKIWKIGSHVAETVHMTCRHDLTFHSSTQHVVGQQSEEGHTSHTQQ